MHDISRLSAPYSALHTVGPSRWLNGLLGGAREGAKCTDVLPVEKLRDALAQTRRMDLIHKPRREVRAQMRIKRCSPGALVPSARAEWLASVACEAREESGVAEARATVASEGSTLGCLGRSEGLFISGKGGGRRGLMSWHVGPWLCILASQIIFGQPNQTACQGVCAQYLRDRVISQNGAIQSVKAN